MSLESAQNNTGLLWHHRRFGGSEVRTPGGQVPALLLLLMKTIALPL